VSGTSEDRRYMFASALSDVSGVQLCKLSGAIAIKRVLLLVLTIENGMVYYMSNDVC
jgi:hypothetical protein